jgi:methylenetetrahydrofolate--tRNA-(uracil-5-)-methyltransferase
MSKQPRIRVIGAGLSGCEASLQLASMGFEVDLYEMRPNIPTPAHRTSNMAELVCSNSFKGLGLNSAHGLMKNELRLLGSFLMQAAEVARVPAGESLSVDREQFSKEVERLIHSNPKITVHLQEVLSLAGDDRPTIVAAGPLCSSALADDMFSRLGQSRMHFFDAIAPVVDAESIDMNHAFWKNRWDKGTDPDFLNCPLNRATYEEFVRKLIEADAVEPKPFESRELFEGCLPVEEMARRGQDTLRFGPMRPVGLGEDPDTGRKWWAVIQLRAENSQRTLFNMVGFQTRLKWGSQKEIFSIVPALRNANFVRLGAMHRNTFIESPKLLDVHLRLKQNGSENGLPPTWFAGQITGAEGYTEAVATGLYAALNLANTLRRGAGIELPQGSCIRALVDHLTAPNPSFQPMNFNFGLLPRPADLPRKTDRKEFLGEQAQTAIRSWIANSR